MYKRVENELEFAMFNGIWTTVWMEKGFELEVSQQVLERFIIVTEEGHYVGTTEIKLYSQDSLINEIYPFDQHTKIQKANGAVAEIDKMALLKSYRGYFISELLSAIVHFGEQHKLRYFVTLLEPVLLRALRISFHVPLEKISQKIYFKGDYVIPAILDVEEVYRNKERYAWLKSSENEYSLTGK